MALASVARLLPSISIALLLANMSSSLNCPDKYALHLGNNNCVYIQFVKRKVFDYKSGEAQCRQLNTDQHVWHLPSMRDKDKHRRFAILFAISDTTSAGWIFWMGLMRDEPTTAEEASNMELWRDQTRWRWVVDNTSLETTAFWEGIEPDNEAFYHSQDLKKTERCTWAVVLRRNGEFWGDWECAGSGPNLEHNTHVLVCESFIRPTTTSTTTTSTTSTTTPTTSSTPTTTPSTQKPSTTDGSRKLPENCKKAKSEQSIAWHWWLLGTCIGLFLICMTIMLVVCYIVNRKRQTGRYEYMNMNTADDISGTSSCRSGSSVPSKSTSIFASFYEKINPAKWFYRRQKRDQVCRIPKGPKRKIQSPKNKITIDADATGSLILK